VFGASQLESGKEGEVATLLEADGRTQQGAEAVERRGEKGGLTAVADPF
jgi:hypothetical protein